MGVDTTCVNVHATSCISEDQFRVISLLLVKLQDDQKIHSDLPLLVLRVTSSITLSKILSVWLNIHSEQHS
jgi:hypothetical protein